jgi:hypothetical protein
VNNEDSKTIVYEKIENVKPSNHKLLKEDLEERTGLSIKRIDVQSIDFLKDTALVIIHYDKN